MTRPLHRPLRKPLTLGLRRGSQSLDATRAFSGWRAMPNVYGVTLRGCLMAATHVDMRRRTR